MWIYRSMVLRLILGVGLALLTLTACPPSPGGPDASANPDDTASDVTGDSDASAFDVDSSTASEDVDADDGRGGLEGDHPDLKVSNVELEESGLDRTGEFARDVSARVENIGAETATGVSCKFELQPLPGEPEQDSATGDLSPENDSFAPGASRELTGGSLYIRADDNDDDNFTGEFRFWCSSPDEPGALEGNNEVSRQIEVKYF